MADSSSIKRTLMPWSRIREQVTVAVTLAGCVTMASPGGAKAAPGPEYSYRLLYELSRGEFQSVNRLCGVALNEKGHAAWIRNGITNPDGTSDNFVRQLWFHDGTQARLLWSSTAATWVAGGDEFYPDCSGTGNPSGGSTVALNDDDLLVVHVEVRPGAPSAQPGQDPPEFFWIDAKQEPAPVLRTAQAPALLYTQAINLNAAGKIGIGAVTNGGTSNAGWLLTATDGVASQSGGFVDLESSWQRGTLINDAGWVVSSFGRGGGCPAGDACSVLLSVLDTTRNDALRLREITVGPGSQWMGGGGGQRGLGFNERGLVSIQGVSGQQTCYQPRLSVFDVGTNPKEYLIAGVGTPIQMQEPGGCSNQLVTGTTMNDWNHLAFGADTWPDGKNSRQIWLADVAGNPFRRIVPLGTTTDPTARLDVGGGRAIFASLNPWIGAESLNDRGQLAINTWFGDAAASGTQQGILIATPCEGCSPGNPALPLEALPGKGWRFDGCRWTVAGGAVAPGQVVECGAWQDPALAIGYDFAIDGDGPPFATVMLPVPLPGGDDSFAVEFGGKSYPLAAGQVFRFTDYVPDGVTAFRISGISPDEELDPTDPTAFVTRVTHVPSADVDFTITMIPITQDDTPIAGFTLSSALVAGCRSVTGTVTLSEPAPVTGATVTVGDTLAAALPPATVKFLAGEVTRRFTIKTLPVGADVSGDVSVTLGPQTLAKPLTLRRIGVASLAMTPTSVVGGNPVTGKATLECKAGPGPITVDLSSNNAGVAHPVAASIVVPQGLQSANFSVTTDAVQTRSVATIAGTASGITKSKRLTVNVAASVSPTTLKFGSVSVGTTGAPLNATLINKGAVPFTVNGISLTGTYASWFAQTNNCPASVAAGTSCTISVTFTPKAALSKSAKLSIATSATSTPLSVSLSGTGI